MFPPGPYHPYLVHFVVAFTILVSIIELAAASRRWQHWRAASFPLLVASVVAVAIAMWLGWRDSVTRNKLFTTVGVGVLGLGVATGAVLLAGAWRQQQEGQAIPHSQTAQGPGQGALLRHSRRRAGSMARRKRGSSPCPKVATR